jgi:hypothetical protein
MTSCICVPRATFALLPSSSYLVRNVGYATHAGTPALLAAARQRAHSPRLETPLRRPKSLSITGCTPLFISRNVAEHLDLDAEGVGRPDAYAPTPGFAAAWAGRSRAPIYHPPGPSACREPRLLRRTPYRCVETLSRDLTSWVAPRSRLDRLPLVGFEADTPLRARFLRVSGMAYAEALVLCTAAKSLCASQSTLAITAPTTSRPI